MSVKRQCELLKVPRSTVYYEPVPLCEEELRIRRVLDELHLRWPFLGARRLTFELKARGYRVNRKRVIRLMRDMGIEAIYPKPRTTWPKKGSEHRVYPYLLKELSIDRPNVAWCADITYIPMARGFCYLMAIMDIRSRRILSWRLSNTLDVRFCLGALEEALERYGPPEVFNTDQGAQFTATAFTSVLEAAGVRISMDGKGAWRDNVFIERFWWSIKYEEVYLHAYDDLRAAREGVNRYVAYYNSERPHSSLGNLTPDTVYEKELLKAA